MTTINTETVTILSGASLSDALNIASRNFFAVIMPAAWTTANLTFQGSYDGTTYYNLYDEAGNEVTFTAAASRYILISTPAKFLGLKKLKVRSGTSGSAVNQGADRAIQIIVVPDA
jgi:hypothetical protein